MTIKQIKDAIREIFNLEESADYESERENYGEAQADRRQIEKIEADLAKHGVTYDYDDSYILAYKHGVLCLKYDMYNDTWYKTERNDWFYWSHNQRCHFIVWRNRNNAIARTTVKPNGLGAYECKVIGPDWAFYDSTEVCPSLIDAINAANEQVKHIINLEYEHPF